MKAIAVAVKALREAFREPQIIILFILFPSLLIAIYFSSFSGTGTSMASLLKLVVIDQDDGPYGGLLVKSLREEKFDGQDAYTILEGLSEKEALIRVQEGKSSLVVSIPRDFSERLSDPRLQPARVILRYDLKSDYAAMARSFLDSSLRGFAGAVTGYSTPVTAEYEFLEGTGTLNDFNASIPGVVIFGVLFGILTAALMLTRETERSTITRLALSGIGSFSFFSGFILAQTALIAIQLPLTYIAALLFGFRSAGPIAPALPFLFLTALGSTGCGILAAAYARDDAGAMNLSLVFLAPLAFLSGSIFPLRETPLFIIGGIEIGWTHILPTRHAARALLNIMVYGKGMSSSIYELIILIVETAVIMATAIAVYGKRRLAFRIGGRSNNGR